MNTTYNCIFRKFDIDISGESHQTFDPDNANVDFEEADAFWLARDLRWGIAFNNEGLYTEHFFLSDEHIAELEALIAKHNMIEDESLYMLTVKIYFDDEYNEFPKAYADLMDEGKMQNRLFASIVNSYAHTQSED